jgi:hypothetical protein
MGRTVQAAALLARSPAWPELQERWPERSPVPQPVHLAARPGGLPQPVPLWVRPGRLLEEDP